jgi:dienelactone hydrolase
VTRRRNFSDWAYWRLQLDTVAFDDPCPLDDAVAFAAWRERAAARLDTMLGPSPATVPLDAETTASVDCGSYTRERVVFDTEATMSVPAYFLVPKARTKPGPAVLAIHGHGPGKDLVCGVVAGGPGDAYADQLARAGYVVLAPDLRGFGERADHDPPDKYHCDWNLVCATMAGVVPLERNLWDCARALDLLAAHPLVDATRIAAAGLSYGGTCTLFLTVRDERIAAAIVSGYLSSWAAAHTVPWNMCGSQVLPGQLGRLEHLDLAALAAPRPLLVESGTDDAIFPAAAATATVAALRTLYATLGADPAAIRHNVFTGDHRWHGAEAEAFLAATVGPGTPAAPK